MKNMIVKGRISGKNTGKESMNSKEKTKTRKSIRLLRLLKLFMDEKELTRKEIFEEIYHYSFENTGEIDKTVEKRWERDLKFLKELGYKVSIKRKMEQNGRVRQVYRLLQNDTEIKFNRLFSEQEKEVIKKSLLDVFYRSKNQSGKDYILFLYTKLFPFHQEEIFNLIVKKKDGAAKSPEKKQNKGSVEKKQDFAKFFTDGAMRIYYRKKDESLVKRDIYPVGLFRNRNLVYLVAWDYQRNDIRNFLLGNIIKFNPAVKKLKKVVLIDEDTELRDNGNYITVKMDELLGKLPHPFFIKVKNSYLHKIELEIGKPYERFFLNEFRFVKLGNANHSRKFVKKIGENEKSVKFHLHIYNIEGLFRFFVRYPNVLAGMESSYQEKYRTFLEEIIAFYER